LDNNVYYHLFLENNICNQITYTQDIGRLNLVNYQVLNHEIR